MTASQLIKLVIGIAVFSVLLAVRGEFEQIWMRALVAACAGVVLGWAILQARKRKA
jgi:hypothetical protein